MAVSGGSSSLPPPRPKSPPEYPDLYGKRRELAKVQMLEREIGFLEDPLEEVQSKWTSILEYTDQEELKSVQGLQPASRCCKEVADFVVASSDPLIPTSRKVRRSRRFWKWLCGKSSCFNLSWICCCGCSPCLERPHCCNCNLRSCCPCFSCSIPKCRCFSWPRSRCFNQFWCSSCCCNFQCPSCPDFSCCKWKCCCPPKCPKVHRCSCCTENCCYHCCFCY